MYKLGGVRCLFGSVGIAQRVLNYHLLDWGALVGQALGALTGLREIFAHLTSIVVRVPRIASL